MASVRDLVANGFHEVLTKEAVDTAGFERKRGRGGLNLDEKGVVKVVKAYNALLVKLTAKVAKFNPSKLNYGDEDETPAPKAKVEKKPAPKPKAKAKAKPVDEDEVEDADEAEDQDDVVEADSDEDEE